MRGGLKFGDCRSEPVDGPSLHAIIPFGIDIIRSIEINRQTARTRTRLESTILSKVFISSDCPGALEDRHRLNLLHQLPVLLCLLEQRSVEARKEFRRAAARISKST